MKNAIMLHGTACTPNSYWFPSIRGYLESVGYRTWVPQLPDADIPDLKKQLPYVLENGEFNEETDLLAHSRGCPLALSVLEHIDTKIHRTILVAGFTRPNDESESDPILQKRYNWRKIRQNGGDIYFINSDNDPWGCNDKQGRYMFQHLGGTLIVRHGEGHMGSDTFNQPYKEFALLERLLSLP